jgi:hypothetical protein
MAQKVMQKNYRLVNSVTKAEVLVFPPHLLGVNADGVGSKTKEGLRVHRFTVVDAMGQAGFTNGQHVVALGGVRSLPTTDINGEKWVVTEIPGLKATRTPKPVDGATPVQTEATETVAE